MKAIHRTVYLIVRGGPGQFHTQTYIVRVHDEVELMRRIDARVPTFSGGREQARATGL